MCRVKLMFLNRQLAAENTHFCVKMVMAVLVLELQGGKKIRMFLLASLISMQNLTEVSRTIR